MSVTVTPYLVNSLNEIYCVDRSSSPDSVFEGTHRENGKVIGELLTDEMSIPYFSETP